MAQKINLDITPSEFMPVLYYSQGDVGREFKIEIVSKDGYDIPSGATVTIQATKPSGLGFTVSGSIADNVVTIVSTAEMTDEYGRFPAELKVVSGNTTLFTGNVLMIGKKNTHPEGTTDGSQETLIPELTVLVQRAESAAETAVQDAIEAADTKVNEILDNLPDEVSQLKSDVLNSKPFAKRNIYSLINATDGSYISADNGAEVATSIVGHTDYIDLSGYYGKLTMFFVAYGGGVTYQGAFYDEDKNYVSGFKQTNVTVDMTADFDIPKNARYIRFSYIISRKNDYYILANSKDSLVYEMYTEFNGDVFTTENAETDHYVRATDGAVLTATGVCASDFINVEFASKIVMLQANGQTHQGAFYDRNKNFVSGYTKQWHNGNYPEEFTVDVPKNAAYIRISYIASLASNYYAILIAADRASIGDIIAQISSYYSNARFSEMKMNCLGDSITYGYIPDSGAQMQIPYPTTIKSILGLAEVRNYGISGSTLAKNSGNYQPMCVRYDDMDDDADIVLVFGGTNDYGRAVYSALGTITDTVNSTIYGALNILCEGLITKYPKALIFLCTPLKRADKTGANGGGYTLEDVAEAIRAVGLKFGMPVLDLDSKGGFYISNETFRAQYGGNDKLHPNQAFDTEHLAPMIARFIGSTI